MTQAKIERISEGAYFIFEPTSFNGSIVEYDPIIANQTILSDCSWPVGLSGVDPERPKPDQSTPPASRA